MKLKDVFEKSVQFFKEKKIETPRLDAEILISYALKMDRVQIYVKYEQPLKEDEITACRELIKRRSLGEPVAYILKEKGFYGEIFEVGPGVLVPRPESEAIVEEALAFIKKNEIKSPRILDLGSGSGCIGLAIIKNVPGATLISIEGSEVAFQYLQKNTQKLELADRTELLHEDIEDFDFSEIGDFDVIVANPPYIDQSDKLVQASVKKFEPHEALFSGNKGLHAILSWSYKTRNILKTRAIMLFEIGHTQGPQVKQAFEDLKVFSSTQILKDLSGLDRTLKCVR